MEITILDTRGVPGAWGEIYGDCKCGSNAKLQLPDYMKECKDIEQLFHLVGKCLSCNKEKTIKEWLGDEAEALYAAICTAHPEWPPGIWDSAPSASKSGEDVDARLKRLRDENLARAFGY